MDSMVNRYTSDRRIRTDDAYTPHGAGGARPDRCVIVYSQRCREAAKDVPIVIGGIEASLRRIAHFDYWSEKVRRSVLLDAKADLLVFGNAERQICEIAHRLAAGKPIESIDDLRGTAFVRKALPEGWTEIDSTSIDTPGPLAPPVDPYAMEPTRSSPLPQAGEVARSAGEGIRPSPQPSPAKAGEGAEIVLKFHRRTAQPVDRERSVIRMPSYEAVADDPILYAHASRILHLEANPGNARALVQRHGDTDVWLNPPPIPLQTKEMDGVYELPYQRVPHPFYGDAKIPAYEMIRFSISIQRGCFGGCTFCSITEHEGRIIQNRSEDSVIREIETIRDTVPGFTGVISDLGGPTANMYRVACKSREIEAACRKPSCVYPGICPNLNTDHSPLIKLYRRARELKGVKKVLIASGVRYDLAIESPEYVKELAQHHVGGYLKIAPEALAEGPLSKMMKPGVGTYDRFKELFDKFSKEAGKEQYLIPYFIAAHPGTSDEDMLAAGALAEAQRLSRRPGAGILAVTDGDGDRDVSLRQESAAQGDAHVRGRRDPQGHAATPPAQGVPALSRSEQLAAVARSAAADGSLRPHRQRAATVDPDLPADRHGPGARGSAQEAGDPAIPHAAHRAAAGSHVGKETCGAACCGGSCVSRAVRTKARQAPPQALKRPTASGFLRALLGALLVLRLRRFLLGFFLPFHALAHDVLLGHGYAAVQL